MGRLRGGVAKVSFDHNVQQFDPNVLSLNDGSGLEKKLG